jgi:hypothetical protein
VLVFGYGVNGTIEWTNLKYKNAPRATLTEKERMMKCKDGTKLEMLEWVEIEVGVLFIEVIV